MTGAVSRRLGRLKVEAVALLLILLTGAAIWFEDDLLDRQIVLSPTNRAAYLPYAYADDTDGGNSHTDMDPVRPLAWSCRLAPGHAYPYCGYGVQLDVLNDGNGIDLSNFPVMAVSLDYQGPAESLRIDLKNRDPGFARFAPGAVNKVNSSEFPLHQGAQTVELNLADFTVAAWWIQQNNIPADFAGAEFGNVTALEMQTGNGAQPGEHRLRIRSITFRGALLTTEQYYGAIMGFWLLVVALAVLARRREARRQEANEAARWRRMLDAIPQMVWSSSGTEQFYNGQWADFAGTIPGSPGCASHVDLIHPDDREMAQTRWQRSLEAGEPYEAEYRLLHHSGDHRYVLSRCFAERDESGAILRWYGTCTDIHDRVVAQQDLWRTQSFNRQLIEATPDGIVVTDDCGFIVFANDAAHTSLNAPADRQLIGKSWIRLVPADVRRVALDAITLEGDDVPRHFTAHRVSIDGEDSWWDVMVTPLATAPNQSARFLVISRDITHQKLAEEQARWSAKHDALTGLPNRVLLQHELDMLAGGKVNFATLVLDIDEFKKINDTLGHDAGDALLCSFAERLKSAARADDMVARLGGDEFAVILKGVRGEADVRAAGDRIFAAMGEPCIHQGKIIDCSTSIGASLYPQHGESRAELLKNADVALYVAKQSGRRNLKVFESSMRADVERRHGMISRARRALANDAIVPYYQPKIELDTGRIAGFEALLRWRHPRNGIQTPDTIKAAFEDLVLAAEISDRMLEQVIADVAGWIERGFAFDHVAFNAGAAELRAGDFADRLLERLAKASVPASCIQMEVTETVFLGRGAEYVDRSLKTLSAAGIRIALDDFGTGYASLTHLKQFPVDLLKIDRSFVRDLQTDAEDDAIVDAVIGLGRSLRIDVIAEGIETRAQHDTLQALGCRYGQGYLYSMPVAAAQVGGLCGGRRGHLRAVA